MHDDIVRDLGHLTLGTRLRRLGERLQAQTQELLDAAGVEVPAALCPLLAALDRGGPQTVGRLTRSLGITQPAVTRALDRLEQGGWAATADDASDRRRRTVALTAAGRAQLALARRGAWPAVERAVAEACAGPAGSLLERLAALEDALELRPLAARATGAGHVAA